MLLYHREWDPGSITERVGSHLQPQCLIDEPCGLRQVTCQDWNNGTGLLRRAALPGHLWDLSVILNKRGNICQGGQETASPGSHRSGAGRSGCRTQPHINVRVRLTLHLFYTVLQGHNLTDSVISAVKAIRVLLLCVPRGCLKRGPIHVPDWGRGSVCLGEFCSATYQL